MAVTSGDLPAPGLDLLDHPLIAERYFFPRRGILAAPFQIDVENARLACHLHTVRSARGTLVHFHGNGEIVDDYLPDFVDLVAQMGWSCFLSEYRGYGGSTGRPELGSMLDDVERVVEAPDVAPSEMVFFGRSVGSIFAVHAASRFPEARGLILESGIADVLERLLLRVHPSEMGVTDGAFQQAVAARLGVVAWLGRMGERDREGPSQSTVNRGSPATAASRAQSSG